MGGRTCCVRNCRRRSNDHRGRRIPSGLTFHRFPAWRWSEGAQVSQLSRRRRAAWVSAAGRSNISFTHIPASVRVCSRHFHSGKPSYEMLESDPDWVPSLHLGHSEGNCRRTERHLRTSLRPERDRKQRRAAKTRPPKKSPGRKSEVGRTTNTDQQQSTGPVRPAALPWREVKSLLQHKNVFNTPPAEETQEQPPAVRKMDLSFRDFFRSALEASLEASSRSRALSARLPSTSGDYKVELNLKLPPVKEEDPACFSSSCCQNCVRLQRRIVELQEKLTRLTGEQEDTEASPSFHEAPLPPDQDLQSPERAHIEDEESEWMKPLSPPQAVLREGDEDEDPADAWSPPSPEDSGDKASKRQGRFKKGWLKMFWFLRYSQTLDQMWCHVCRLYADKSHRNLALIKGSSLFKVYNIKKHSNSNYHKDHLKRYMLKL